MLRSFCIIIILTQTFSAFSQEKIYLDGEWKECRKKEAQYLALVTTDEKDLNKIEVKHYPSLAPWSIGQYHSRIPKLSKAEGEIKWFYDDGAIRQKSFYVNGVQEGDSWLFWPDGQIQEEHHFQHGLEEGTWITYAEDGDTIEVSNYSAGKYHGKHYLFNSGHKLFEEATYDHGILEGPYKLYAGKDSLDFHGQYKNDKKEGIWMYYHRNGQLASKENYEADKIISAEIFDTDGKPQPLKISLEELIAFPKYIGGEEAFYRTLSQYIVYTEEAKENNIQGKVYMTLTIDPSGKVLTVKQIRQKLGYGLDEEAMKAMKKMTDWEKFSNHNRQHPISITLPIKFTLR
ncbi:MAG: TonB family protein [Flavobacteriales bacterium]|nr:TonB family protein [Flavobacteriales bacterium]